MPEDKQHMNLVGKVSHFFASNQPLTILLLAASLLFGLISFFLTPKQYNPEIVRPAFAVTLTYAGADVDEAIDRVVYELVEKVYAVPGVDEVLTEVSDGARVTTTVIFDVGHDKTKAKVDLLSQLEQHSYLAQGFISEPTVIEINPETIPVLQVVFGSDSLTVAEVRERVIKLGHTLTNISDVSGVSVTGGYRPSLVVAVDPAKLQLYGLTVLDVQAVLEGSAQRLVTRGYEGEEYRVEAVFDSRATTPAEAGALRLTESLRLRDVASVYEGTAGARSYVLHQAGTNAPGEVVVLAVSKVEGSSAPNVTTAVRTVLDDMLQDDASLQYEVVGDDGRTAREEIYGLSFNLITSIVIVGGVLLLFLSTRAATVVLVAIPVTLLVVFGLGYLFGETINRITLFALILSLGLLVDSAIVVVENIYSHLQRASEGVRDATRELIVAGAVHEIGIGLLLSTVTSVIVFLPMFYITGMMGPYMGPIAFFVPAALIVALLVAIVITPFLSSILLRGEEQKTRLGAMVDGHMTSLIERYTVFMKRILYSRVAQQRVLRGALLVFLGTLILPAFGLVHFQMLPRADRDQFYVYLDAPVDTATEETRRIAGEIAALMAEDEEVQSVQQFIAQPPVLDFNGMFKGAQSRQESYQASMRVNLTRGEERGESSTSIVNRLRAELATTYPNYAALVRFIEEPPGPPVRATLVAKVSASNVEAEAVVAEGLYQLLPTVTGVVDPYVSRDEPVGSIQYRFDHDMAAELDVRVTDVRDTVALLNGPVPATEYVAQDSGEYAPVLLMLPSENRDEPSDMHELRVRSLSGESVPLSSLVEQTYMPRIAKAYMDRAERLTYVTGEVEERSIVYVVIELMRTIQQGGFVGYEVQDWSLFSMDLVNEAGEEASITWGGEWEMTLENFRDLGIAMGVALLLVYGVLVAQYRSFSRPAFILVTVPLGLVGILWGFLVLDQLFGIYLTATALIGFIALIGIVVNNAIIYLEYVEQARQDLPFREALLAAGSARLRPIFLTSLTTILGSLTIAADPVWSGLAWAIVFGLSLSTVLTLLIYPTLLVYFGDEE